MHHPSPPPSSAFKPSKNAPLACWLVAFCLGMASCDRTPGDYARFRQTTASADLRVQEPWKDILAMEPLPSGIPPVPQPGRVALLEDILQIGPWPALTPEERADLDTAWSAFTGFEGTRMAVEGIRDVLTEAGRIREATATLEGAFGRWSHWFPDAPVPELNWAYTGFNYSVYPTDELLLVGCEFFLGADHPAILGLPPTIYPRYMQERMVPNHLAADALRGWLLVHFQDRHYEPQGQLADELLYWGKILYLARCLAPDIPPHDLMDWTPQEWAWAEEHERQLWSELRKEEVLYTRRKTDIQRWVNDAPFTKAGTVPQESPDRLGWYLGWRWIEDHMEKKPHLTLPDMMALTEVLPVLQTYRPRN